MRGSIAGARYFHLVDSPWEGRKQVRIQLKNGADFIKVYVAEITGLPTMTAEEQQAIVDEAHRQGVRVACTGHAGIAVRQSIEAGCNSLELLTDIEAESVRMAVERGTFMTFGLTTTKNNRSKIVPELSKRAFRGRSRPVPRSLSVQTRRAPTAASQGRIMEKKPQSSQPWSNTG
jgi:imidazolonepropionase-like amidohydrolase